MKKIVVLFLIVSFGQSLICQEVLRKFGEITAVDIEMQKCDFEPDAAAVVIFDEGSTILVKNENKFVYLLERKVRIKILTDAGVSWSEVEVPYYNSQTVNEQVFDIQAKSYNFEDGQLKIVTIGESECHIEKINENWSRKKFAIPNVRAGTVIDYTYTINSDYILNLPDWEFQWQIPVLNSRYTIGMIPFYEYQFLLQGANEFDEYNSIKSTGLEREFFGVKFTDMIYTFGMKNLPSFKDESYITSASDYIIKLDFQLSKINYPNGGQVDVLTTWPLLIKDMMVDPDFGKFAIAARKQAKNLIPVSRLILLPEQQRLDSVVNFVKTNFQWNESYGLHVRQKMKEILTKRRASSSEINLLTVGLLNAVGIKADPVILSTRNNGKVKRSYPFLNSFNNTIAVATVDSNQVLIDATDLLLPNNRIPTSCLNELGLVIREGKEEWIGLNAKSYSKTKTSISSKIVNGVLESDINAVFSDYDALFMRKNYGDNRKALLKRLADENEYVEDTSLSVSMMDHAQSPYKLHYRVSNRLTTSDENIYIEPFLQEAPTENMFKSKTRTYPVDLMYPYQRNYFSLLQIPEGYEVGHLPTNRTKALKDMEFEYTIAQQDDKLMVSLIYVLKKSIYDPGEYALLKSFFEEMIGKSREKIVLKRKHAL